MPINRHRWTKAAGGGAATSVTAAAFPLLAPDGSAAAPSYSFSSDPDTGWYWASSQGAIAFSANNFLSVQLSSTANFFANPIHIGNTSGTSYSGLNATSAGVLRVLGSGGGSGTGWFQGDAGKTRLAADQTVVTNSTTLASINNLTITVAASRHYHFRAYLYFTTINTSGVKVAVSGTATHTNIIYDVIIHGISTPGFLTSGRATAKDTAVGVTASGTSCCAEIIGVTTINAGGTFLLQAAQNAETGAAESVIALRGSHFLVTDLA